jgi:hypothetical protein
MRRFFFLGLFLAVFFHFAFPKPVFATQCGEYSVDWTINDNTQSAYYGRISLCVGGFISKDDLRNSSISFSCSGDCTNPIKHLAVSIFGGNEGESVSLSQTPDLEIGKYQEGKSDRYYTCVTGDIDGTVIQVIQDIVNTQGVACTLQTGSQLILNSKDFIVKSTSGELCNFNDSPLIGLPSFTGTLNSPNGKAICSDTRQIKLENVKQSEDNRPFVLCEHTGVLKNICETSCQTSALWTAIGCVPTDYSEMTKKLISFFVGLSGGFALILILIGSFTVATSVGNQDRLQEGRNQIASALVGLFLIIFSIILLHFIGIEILRLPGLN